MIVPFLRQSGRLVHNVRPSTHPGILQLYNTQLCRRQSADGYQNPITGKAGSKGSAGVSKAALKSKVSSTKPGFTSSRKNIIFSVTVFVMLGADVFCSAFWPEYRAIMQMMPLPFSTAKLYGKK